MAAMRSLTPSTSAAISETSAAFASAAGSSRLWPLAASTTLPARSSHLRTPRARSHRARREMPSLRAAEGVATLVTARSARSLRRSSAASRPGKTSSSSALSRAMRWAWGPPPWRGGGRDQRPQLRGLLVSGLYLLERAPPHPELVGDHAGVAAVALVLATVALAGAVDGGSRQVEHPLAEAEKDRLQ